MTTSARRNAWVDAGKGIAIILVALFHATNWGQLLGTDQTVWKATNAIVSTLRMPLFFTFAGLFAAKWLTASWGRLFRQKILLFAWVFIIWQIIGAVVTHVGDSAFGRPGSVAGSVKGVLWSPLFPRLELWFIWALAVFFVLAKLTRRIDWRVQLGVAAVSSVLALWLWIEPREWRGVAGVAKYYAFFLAGLHLKDRILAFGDRLRPHSIATLLLAWAAVSIPVGLLGLAVYPGVYFANCVLGVLAGIALSRCLDRSRLLAHIGTRTLPIYVVHTPAIILFFAAISLSPLALGVARDIWWALPVIGATVGVLAGLGLNRVATSPPLRYLLHPPATLQREPDQHGASRASNDTDKR